jgi:hypothetical protein
VTDADLIAKKQAIVETSCRELRELEASGRAVRRWEGIVSTANRTRT